MRAECFILALTLARLWGAEPPASWIDPDTHHRVMRLTAEPGSAGLYFNQDAYTANGKHMIYTTPDGISAVDLDTFLTKSVVKGKVRVIATGRKTANVYYWKDGAIYSTDVDTGATRKILTPPARASVATINADETLLAGTYIVSQEGSAGDTSAQQRQIHPLDQPVSKGQMIEERLAAHLPMVLFVADTRTGAVRTILRSTDWLNHLQFSPTDPNLVLLCHEGPWHKVDRIWTIRSDGSGLTKIHTRTMAMEIAGHEFWSHDGSTIWYDLQTPRGEVFWLAGYNVNTGERTWYHLDRDEWSIHFNVTRDGQLFCGDGGDERQVAHAADGKWIYLFRSELIKNRGIGEKDFVNPGVLHAERLVNMSKHDYRLEPNVRFSPDQKWVIFRSNMFGPTYTFAVEVARSN
jgi:oligogalacturonide lyase